MRKLLVVFVIIFCCIAAGVIIDHSVLAESEKKRSTKENSNKTDSITVKMSEEKWKEKLTPEQYRILRKAGTERPFGEVYSKFKKQGSGTYVCAGCDSELFSSNEKFDSKCGWPSFYDPSNAKNVKTSVDYLLGYPRTEVLCSVCDGHLGHVFTGEGFDTPTDKRYCINGTVLKFIPNKIIDSNSTNPE